LLSLPLMVPLAEGKGPDNHFDFIYPKKISFFKKNKSIETLVFRNKKND